MPIRCSPEMPSISRIRRATSIVNSSPARSASPPGRPEELEGSRGHVDAEEAVQEPGALRAPERDEADDHPRALEDAPGPDQLRPLPQAIDVVRDLRPHDVAAGVELRLQLRGIVRIRERHVRDTDQVARRIRDLGARAGRPLVADPPRESDHLVRSQVEHRFRVGMITDVHRVPAEDQEVPSAERPASEEVGRDRQPIPIAADELEGRLGARLVDEASARQRRHVRRRRRVVGDVHGVHIADESPRGLTNRRAVTGARRYDLAREDELAGVEQRGQPAPVRTHPP